MLTPLLLAADAPGKEIPHPVAVVIFGGLVSLTLLGTLPHAGAVLAAWPQADRAIADGARGSGPRQCSRKPIDNGVADILPA